MLVCFDTDDVGNKGADSAISIIENGMKGIKIDLSPFKEPMDMITKEGVDAFRERLNHSRFIYIRSKKICDVPKKAHHFFYYVIENTHKIGGPLICHQP